MAFFGQLVKRAAPNRMAKSHLKRFKYDRPEETKTISGFLSKEIVIM